MDGSMFTFRDEIDQNSPISAICPLPVFASQVALLGCDIETVGRASWCFQANGAAINDGPIVVQKFEVNLN